MINTVFLLLVGHAMADYVFQSDVMSTEKRRSSTTKLQKIVPWYYWLTSHSLVHGFFVYLATGSTVLGIAETAAHWLIDFGKCEGKYNLHVDQALHLLCKVLWFGWLYRGLVLYSC